MGIFSKSCPKCGYDMEKKSSFIAETAVGGAIGAVMGLMGKSAHEIEKQTSKAKKNLTKYKCPSCGKTKYS